MPLKNTTFYAFIVISMLLIFCLNFYMYKNPFNTAIDKPTGRWATLVHEFEYLKEIAPEAHRRAYVEIIGFGRWLKAEFPPLALATWGDFTVLMLMRVPFVLFCIPFWVLGCVCGMCEGAKARKLRAAQFDSPSVFRHWAANRLLFLLMWPGTVYFLTSPYPAVFPFFLWSSTILMGGATRTMLAHVPEQL